MAIAGRLGRTKRPGRLAGRCHFAAARHSNIALFARTAAAPTAASAATPPATASAAPLTALAASITRSGTIRRSVAIAIGCRRSRAIALILTWGLHLLGPTSLYSHGVLVTAGLAAVARTMFTALAVAVAVHVAIPAITTIGAITAITVSIATVARFAPVS